MNKLSGETVAKERRDDRRVLVLGEDEARLVTGSGKRPSASGNRPTAPADLARIADELAAHVWHRHPGEAARVFIVAPEGALAGAVHTELERLAFASAPDPRLIPLGRASGDDMARYRAALAESAHRITATDRKALGEELDKATSRALAALGLGVSEGDAGQVGAAPRVQFFDLSADRPPQRDPAGRLLASYTSATPSLTAYAGRHPLPNRRVVVRVTDAFLPLLFPGYHGPRVGSRWFAGFVRGRVAWLRNHLGKQVARALRFSAGDGPGVGAGEYRRWGAEKADALLAALPRIRAVLERDVAAAFEADPAVFEHHEIVACYPGVYAVAVHRLAHELEGNGVPLIPRMMAEHAHSRTGIDIHPGAAIGPGFFVDHGTGVVVGQTTTVGENVTLYQGVTLGAFSFPRDETGALVRGAKRHPTLEKGVVVYANASILGGDTVIGHHSAVGANVSQVRSLPPETVVFREKQHVVVRPRQVPSQPPTDPGADSLWVMD